MLLDVRIAQRPQSGKVIRGARCSIGPSLSGGENIPDVVPKDGRIIVHEHGRSKARNPSIDSRSNHGQKVEENEHALGRQQKE